MDCILEAKNINKSFGGIKALTDVNFKLAKGEVHCLVGENGAGKSTLGKVIAGIHSPDNGTIEISGKSFTSITPIQAKDLKIAMVTQELNLMPHLSIAENIFMFEDSSYNGTVVNWLNRKKIYDLTENLFKQFNLTNIPSANTKVSNLTIAQQQIVEIIRAVAMKNNVLIFDEPTTSLSINEVEQLFKLIRRLKADGVSIVLVTHRFNEIFEIGDLVTVLCDGKIVKERVPISELDHYKLVKLMVGRDISDFYGEKESLTLGKTVFEVKDLSDGKIVDDVSFSVRESEIVGFAGLVGAGRTEIMETIFGIRKMVKGTVKINGQTLKKHSTKNNIIRGISLIPEDRKQKGLAVNLPIASNMNQVKMNLKRGLIVNEGQFRTQNKQMVDRLKIKLRDLSQKVNNLSGGNQQKVLLAKWLSIEQSVVIFDEPTRGIDVGTKVELYQLIRKLAKAGKAIIIVSSEMQELIALCDRIFVVNQGSIVGEFDGNKATEEKILRSAISGK